LKQVAVPTIVALDDKKRNIIGFNASNQMSYKFFRVCFNAQENGESTYFFFIKFFFNFNSRFDGIPMKSS
jgi:hypothetical protein